MLKENRRENLKVQERELRVEHGEILVVCEVGIW